MLILTCAISALLLPFSSTQICSDDQEGVLGYYRNPAIHGDTVVFTAEGDLWKVSTKGGIAQRLTTHPGMENHPAISPDGKWVAFSAGYEGPVEAYVMPINGGVPTRCTYEGGVAVVGWTHSGQVLYSTSKYSALPNLQICSVDPVTHRHNLIPLAQASDGSFSDDGKSLFFTRLSFQGSQTKRYQGGTAQSAYGLERTDLLCFRPGRSHEHMVDDSNGKRPSPAHASHRLRCSITKP